MERSRLENAIQALTELLRRGESVEDMYQQYFETHRVVFDVLGYDAAYPKLRFPLPDGEWLEPDFLVSRPSGLFEVFELKTPQERLMTSRRHRERLTAKVQDYLAQARQYSSYFDDAANRGYVSKTYGLDVQEKPDMVIVAGLDAIVDKRRLHLALRDQVAAPRIITYDGLLSDLHSHCARLFAPQGNLPGASWHAVVTLQEVDLPRRKYIFDGGEGLAKNRWSVFVDEHGRLTFEVIDSRGIPYSVSVHPSLHTFQMGQPYHVCCEFGSSDTSGFLQILVNNRIVASLKVGSPIEIDQDANLFAGSTIGADLTGQNHGSFTLAALAIYNVVLDYWQKQGLAAATSQGFLSEQP
jgi:hypothetical protein